MATRSVDRLSWIRSLARKRVLLVVAALAVGSAAIGTIAFANDDGAALARFEAVGTARVGGTDAPALRVNEEEISDARVRERIASVNSNLDYMKEEIAKGSPFAARLSGLSGLINQFGVQTVGVAALIEESSLYQEAVAKGYRVADGTVAARVKRDRDLAEQGLNPGVLAYVDVVGKDRYWTELYPEIIRRTLTIENMRTAITRDLVDPREQQARWDQTRNDLISAAVVTILDSDLARTVSADAAKAYLAEQRALMRQ
jgi:hypothetical protein